MASEARTNLPQLRDPPTYSLSRSIVSLSDPNGGPSEAIRSLRTHIMAKHIDAGRRALAVCAASSGVGATYVATNLAVALSQIGLKTLLIDGNLRNPGIGEVIRPSVLGPGLYQCLASDEDFGGFIDADVVPNLSVIYAGGIAPNPQELLARDRFDALMSFCLRDFELTIVDTPPANTCSDARRISTVLGYSMVIARKDSSRVDDLKTLISEIQGDGGRVIGTVLNEF